MSSNPGVVWIAGVGAREGLGAAVARRFSREGYATVVTGRTAARIAAVQADISAAGGEAYAFAGDISVEQDVNTLAAKIAAIGPLTAAVFNAGNAVWVPTLDLSVEQFEQAWRVNTLGGFLFGRAALRAILENRVDVEHATGRGSLLFTGASASLRGRPPFGAFASAKAGLRSLAQTLAREFGPQGVHVAHIVVDGGIDGERLRANSAERVTRAGVDGLLKPDAIAEVYWQLHTQHRSAWTHELDLRPFKENF